MITFEKIRLAYPSCSPPPPPSPSSPAGDVRLQRKQGRPLQRFLHFFFLLSHNWRFLLSRHFLSSVFSLSPVFIFTQVVPRFCPASYSLFSLFPHKLWPLPRFCPPSYSQFLTFSSSRLRLRPTLTWASTGEAGMWRRRSSWRSCPTSRTWRSCWLSWFTDIDKLLSKLIFIAIYFTNILCLNLCL